MVATGKQQVLPLTRRRRAILFRRKVIIPLLLALLVLIALIGWSIMRGSPAERGTAMLVSTYEKHRVVEPRLSGGFHAGTFLAGQTNSQAVDPASLDRARDLIFKAASDEEDPSAHLAYARLSIIEGEGVEAERRLRKILEKMPASAQARNDLGVSLFEQHKIEDAVEEFEGALEGSPRMAEALFNRALCYERLLLIDAAKNAYEQFIKVEPASGWAREAQARLLALSRPQAVRTPDLETQKAFEEALAADDRDRARKIADENFEVLTKYALLDLSLDHLTRAVAGDRQTSEAALRKIATIGNFFIETKGDRYISDTAEYLWNLDEKKRASELDLLKEYIEACKKTESKDAQEKKAAFDHLTRLAAAFRARDNLMRAERAEIRVAKFLYEDNLLDSSLRIINNLLPVVEKRGWLFERAWVFGHIGLIHARLGGDTLALGNCEKAIAIVRQMREKAQIAKHLQTLSVAYGRLGDLDKALASYRESLELTLSAAPQPRELAFTYFDLANLYRRQGNHKLAQVFADQALNCSEKAGDTNRTCQILSLTSLEQLALQQEDGAKQAVDKSLSLLPNIDSGQRAFTEPLVLSQAGEVAYRCGDRSKAIEYFTRAESLASKVEDNKFLLIQSLKGRAEAYAAQGMIAQARADVDRILEIIEIYRTGIAESKYRSSFLDASQSAFDQIISLNLTSFENPKEAFNVSERARARALLDKLAPRIAEDGKSRASTPTNLSRSVTPLGLDQIQPALPDDLVLLQYSVTDKETYIFIVKRSGIEVVKSVASAELIDGMVRRYLSALRSKAPVAQLKKYAAELYNYLFEPVEDRIPPGASVCIAPDKALHFFPFAALVDGNDNYLIQSYRLSYTPSASVLVHCLNEDRNKPAREREQIVAVGNPAYDEEKLVGLRRLPDAEQEATASASFYDDRIILKPQEATESRVLAAMKQCDVAHLALHCLVEEKSPWLAALVLANTKQGPQPVKSMQSAINDDGMLYLDEVYNLKLPLTRLVVLSACQTALGQYYRGEGIVSIVRPFISSGVPTVVASLWPVESKATASLMVEFHKQRKQVGNKTNEALRAAQIRMAAGGTFEHPYYWAPFIAIGSAN
jgi:CHAT domain-containing protein/Tfp pilus assembly protein PilF